MKPCYFEANPRARGGYTIETRGGFIRGCLPNAGCNQHCWYQSSPRYSSTGEYATPVATRTHTDPLPKKTSSTPLQAERGRAQAYKKGAPPRKRASSKTVPKTKRDSIHENTDRDYLSREFANIRLGRSQSTRQHKRPTTIDLYGNECDLAALVASCLFRAIHQRQIKPSEQYPFPIHEIDKLPQKLLEGYTTLATGHTENIKFNDILSSAENYLKEFKYLEATESNRMNQELLGAIISYHRSHIIYHQKELLKGTIGFSDDELNTHDPDIEVMHNSLIHYSKSLSFIDLCGQEMKGSIDTVFKQIRELEALTDRDGLSFSDLAEVKTTEFVLRRLLGQNGLSSSANLPAVLLYAKLIFWDKGDFNSGSLPVIMREFDNCEEDLTQRNYDLIRNKLKDTILSSVDVTGQERKKLLKQIDYSLETSQQDVFETKTYYDRKYDEYFKRREFIGTETTTTLIDNETDTSKELHRSFIHRSQTI